MKALTNLLILFLLTFASLGDAKDIESLEDLTLIPATGFNLIVTHPSMSASQPLKLGSSKEFVTGLIDLTSEITGTLPIANGGTGSATQNFVDLTTTQSVSGDKNFTSGTFSGTLAVTGLSTFSSGSFSGPLSAGQFATVGLPAAASYDGYLVYDTTVNELLLSDGATWNGIGTTIYSNPNPSFANTEIFGAGATATATYAVSFGTNANAVGSNSVAIGSGANSNNTGSITLGAGAFAIGNDSISIGTNANTNNKASSIIMGTNAISRTANSFVLGGAGSEIEHIYIGAGEYAPNGNHNEVSIRPTRPTAKTDTQGGELVLAGAGSTGTAVGASVKIQTQTATSVSGVTENTTWSDMFEARGDGEIILNAENAVTADGSMWNNSVSIYLDETAGTTILKSKNSAGSVATVTLGAVSVPAITDLDTFYRDDFSVNTTAFFSVTGDNATPDNAGTGTMSGSLISRGSGTAMNGITDLGFLSSGAGTNDFFLSDTISVSDIAASQTATFSFWYEYNGADDDMSFIVLDSTNDTVISHATNHDLKLTSEPTRFYATIDIPSTCTDIRYGFQRNAGTTKTLYFTNVTFKTPMLELFETKTLSADVSTTSDVANLQFDNLTIGRKYNLGGVLRGTVITALKVIAYSAASGAGTEYAVILDRSNGSGTSETHSGGVNLTFEAVSTSVYIRLITPFSDVLNGDGTNGESFLTLTEKVDVAETTKF